MFFGHRPILSNKGSTNENLDIPTLVLTCLDRDSGCHCQSSTGTEFIYMAIIVIIVVRLVRPNFRREINAPPGIFF